MRIINLDAQNWKTEIDVNNAILCSLDAPASYTRGSLDALLELMVLGEVGATEPPYILRLSSTKGLPAAVAEWLSHIVEGIAEYRADQKAQWGHDIEANLEIVS